jgi:hypothetical protein
MNAALLALNSHVCCSLVETRTRTATGALAMFILPSSYNRGCSTTVSNQISVFLIRIRYDARKVSSEETARKFGRMIFRIRLTLIRGVRKNILDYVIRRFDASSAGLKKPVGLDLRWVAA